MTRQTDAKSVPFAFTHDGLSRETIIPLIAALRHPGEVVPVFIVDPRQAGVENPYRSDHAILFMREALTAALQQDLLRRGACSTPCSLTGTTPPLVSGVTCPSKKSAPGTAFIWKCTMMPCFIHRGKF